MANLVSSLTNTVDGLAEESQCGSIVKREIVPQATWVCDKAEMNGLSLIGGNI